MPRASKPSAKPSTFKIRIRIVHGDADAFGPGKAQLLESLLETESLNRTSSAMKMSYMKALALVRSMNAQFQEPLVSLSRGGKRGGGAQVTGAGRLVLAEYQAMRAATEAAAESGWKRLRRLLKK